LPVLQRTFQIEATIPNVGTAQDLRLSGSGSRVERGLVFAPADLVPTGQDKPADQCGSNGCSDRDHDAEVSEEIAVD